MQGKLKIAMRFGSMLPLVMTCKTNTVDDRFAGSLSPKQLPKHAPTQMCRTEFANIFRTSCFEKADRVRYDMETSMSSMFDNLSEHQILYCKACGACH